jgi:CheY-like chemotaxis protein
MTKKKILLIDDEPDLCRVIKLNLERSGDYEVTTASSGPEGLEKVKVTEFDLVITDFNMPGMDGAAVLHALKAIKPNAPVVLCSVYHDDPTRITRALQQTADGLIGKPIDHERLRATIQHTLSKSEAGKGNGRISGGP